MCRHACPSAASGLPTSLEKGSADPSCGYEGGKNCCRAVRVGFRISFGGLVQAGEGHTPAASLADTSANIAVFPGQFC